MAPPRLLRSVTLENFILILTFATCIPLFFIGCVAYSIAVGCYICAAVVWLAVVETIKWAAIEIVSRVLPRKLSIYVLTVYYTISGGACLVKEVADDVLQRRIGAWKAIRRIVAIVVETFDVVCMVTWDVIEEMAGIRRTENAKLVKGGNSDTTGIGEDEEEVEERQGENEGEVGEDELETEGEEEGEVDEVEGEAMDNTEGSEADENEGEAEDDDEESEDGRNETRVMEREGLDNRCPAYQNTFHGSATIDEETQTIERVDEEDSDDDFWLRDFTDDRKVDDGEDEDRATGYCGTSSERSSKESEESESKEKDDLNPWTRGILCDKYEEKEIKGRGGFSEVKRVVSRETAIEYACKTIYKSTVDVR